jgi:hypothetical protein
LKKKRQGILENETSVAAKHFQFSKCPAFFCRGKNLLHKAPYKYTRKFLLVLYKGGSKRARESNYAL